jgi:hypothetical protein
MRIIVLEKHLYFLYYPKFRSNPTPQMAPPQGPEGSWPTQGAGHNVSNGLPFFIIVKCVTLNKNLAVLITLRHCVFFFVEEGSPKTSSP